MKILQTRKILPAKATSIPMAFSFEQARKLEMPDDFAAASALVRSLISSRSTRTEQLEQPDVVDAIETIGRQVANPEPTVLRLESTSLLGKASETFNSKTWNATVAALINRGLTIPLPSIGNWGNADDRRYLAKAITQSNATWIAQYAAEALAQAELSEKVSRDIWAELAITRADNVATALRTVAKALDDWVSRREDSIELSYRKVRRICEALGKTLLTADVPSGRNFGEGFNGLVRVAGGGKGADALKAREEAAVGVLDLLIQILRLRFEILFDSNIYRAVGTVRGWWRPARPPEEIEIRVDRITQNQ